MGDSVASVSAERLELRCWPTANSPNYEDVLLKDTAVRIGRAEAGYREIRLPIGPVGYVHKNFTSAPEAGKVQTTGKGVAFRYRPRSGEAPVTSLSEGAELWIVGEEDGWWRVRNPGVVGWLPEADLLVYPSPPETMELALAEFEKVQRGQVQDWLDHLAALDAKAKLADERRKALLDLQERFGAELKKPPAEQDLEPILVATDALLAAMDEGSELEPPAMELKRRIGAQQWVVEATLVRDSKPVPSEAAIALPPAVVADPLERFQSVGFLRWEKGLTGPGRYMVEKGGQPLYVVTCASGRYDLGLFVDCEVGLVGSSRRPDFESLRVLDVERIEVLAGRQ